MEHNIEQDSLFVAQQCADATREKLADIYAKAFLGACLAMGASYADVCHEFRSFLDDVCASFPKFQEVLTSANVSVEEKYGIIDRVCGGSTTVFKNFLKVLARRGRLDMLQDVYKASLRLNLTRSGKMIVQVTTATPIDSVARENLTASLRKLVGGEPVLSNNVDPDVIGGVIVRVGDVVYDASILTQLNKVRQNIVYRSAHEIQSRRDCFRNTEGD